MPRWLRRIRGVVGMGVTWAVGWAVGGVLMGVGMAVLGLPMEWFVQVFDAPLPAMAVPGFFYGAVFSAVLGIVGRRRRFDQLLLPRFTAWGAVGGLSMSLLLVAMLGTGASTGPVLLVLGTLTLLSAASAAGTLAVARMGEDRELFGAGGDVSRVGLTDSEVRELLGREG